MGCQHLSARMFGHAAPKLPPGVIRCHPALAGSLEHQCLIITRILRAHDALTMALTRAVKASPSGLSYRTGMVPPERQARRPSTALPAPSRSPRCHRLTAGALHALPQRALDRGGVRRAAPPVHLRGEPRPARRAAHRCRGGCGGQGGRRRRCLGVRRGAGGDDTATGDGHGEWRVPGIDVWCVSQMP